MKIIHCADLHLDSQMTANLTKEQARERKREIIRTFTRMVEYAEKTGVRLIMISGDLFDTRNVSALARNTVRDMICTHPQIDFLYLRGNHDSDNFLSKLEEVPDNLLLFSDTWTAYRYGNIVISGIELSENNRATVYNSLVLGHEDFNIVMMHGQAGDYACRSQAENISLNQLKNKNIDYLALGLLRYHRQITPAISVWTNIWPCCGNQTQLRSPIRLQTRERKPDFPSPRL